MENRPARGKRGDQHIEETYEEKPTWPGPRYVPVGLGGYEYQNVLLPDRANEATMQRWGSKMASQGLNQGKIVVSAKSYRALPDRPV